MDLLSLSGVQILAITSPEKLYTNDVTEAKKEYRKLANKWHPDRGGDDAVFAHLKGLYEAAEKKIIDGTWKVPGMIRVESIDGRRFEVRYKKHHSFELGEMYITDTVLVYMIEKANRDLYDNAKRRVKLFKYANDKMKKEFSRYVPEILTEVETKDHLMVVYKKTADVLLLRDVMNHFGGTLPTTHVAWILSSLYNLACYFKYGDFSHNAISPDTYFISPKYHSGVMLGGWWYSAPIGEKLIAVPERTILHAPADLMRNRVGDPKIDSYLIKATGLEMMGDAFGSSLLMKAKADKKKYPDAFMTWLRTPGSNMPVREYETYKKKILVESWGPPKFHKLELTSSELYP